MLDAANNLASLSSVVHCVLEVLWSEPFLSQSLYDLSMSLSVGFDEMTPCVCQIVHSSFVVLNGSIWVSDILGWEVCLRRSALRLS